MASEGWPLFLSHTRLALGKCSFQAFDFSSKIGGIAKGGLTTEIVAFHSYRRRNVRAIKGFEPGGPLQR